ncbi:hypothetical protein BY996DRAFT_6574214 [Phakopsora pachyrhizi]|nr:hypothetical protein BY996DRAFT_6574214 [Phakopsora pachyrhizi]
MSSSTQSSFDPTLKLSSIPSKQIRHTDHEQLKSVETLYQLRFLRTSHLPSGNLKSSDTEDSKYHLSGDQINCSSDWSHLQQTFHLSSNPLRMHNSSSSSASSSTDSWDFDPDLIIPDDSEKDTEDSTVSSSIESALISSNAALANQVSHSVNREHNLLQLGCFESEVEDEDEERGEVTGRGGTLKLKIIKPQQINNSLDSISLRLSLEHQSTIKALGPSLGEKDETRQDSEGIRLTVNPKSQRMTFDRESQSRNPPAVAPPPHPPSANQTTSRSAPQSYHPPHSHHHQIKNAPPDLVNFPVVTRDNNKPTPSLMSDCSSSPFTEDEDDINKGFFDDIEFPPKFGIPNNLHPASTSSNPSSLPYSKLHKPIDQAQAGLDWDKDIVLPEGGLGAIIMKKLEDEKDQKDQKAKSKEDIRTSRGKSKFWLES